MTVIISQSDYKIFSSKVKKLASKGIDLDYKVTKPNHKRVKITVVIQPRPLEYIAISAFEKPISL